MLFTLYRKLVERRYIPHVAVAEACGITKSSAFRKLKGYSKFTIDECIAIYSAYFTNSNIAYDVLFKEREI